MKTKRFLVKSLATMLAFLFVVSGMAFPAFAATESTETIGGDLGDKLVAINVAIHGQVSLLFYFTDLDNVSYFKVVIPTQSGAETKEVQKDSLKYDSAKDRYLLEVSIAAAQQTDTISVQAFDANNNGGKVRGYSVRNYADMVFALAEKDPDKYYYACEALKAMLNYGAMAQKYFGYNTTNLANDGLYADGTNPVNGMNASNMYILPDWTSTLEMNGSVGFALARCVLDGKVSLRIYPSYTGDFSKLSVRAGFSKDNLVNDQLYQDEKGYYIAINGVSAKSFDHLYYVEITDTANNNTVTRGSYSVLNYVQGLFNEDPELAASMYMYYVWVSAYVNNTTEGFINPGCTHTRTHIDLKGVPGETCSDCGYFFAGFKILGSDTDAACPDKNHNVEAYWTGRDAIHYNVSEYENVTRDGIRFNNTIKSLTLSNFWNSEETDASFNRFSLSYYSSEPVKITLNYTLGGSKKSSDYYLEAGEHTFNAVLPEFLDNGKASSFDSIVVESCKPDAEVAFVLFDYVLETLDLSTPATLSAASVSFDGSSVLTMDGDASFTQKLSIDLAYGGAITWLSHAHVGKDYSLVKNVATSKFAQYDWQIDSGTRLIDVQILDIPSKYSHMDGFSAKVYPAICVKYLTGENGSETATYFECTYSAVYNDNGGLNVIQVDNRQIDFSGVDGKFDVHSLPTLHTITFPYHLYAFDGGTSWENGSSPTLYETSATPTTHNFRNSTKEAWCAWVSDEINGIRPTIGIYVPNVDSFEVQLAGNSGEMTDYDSTENYGRIAMQKTMKTYSYEAIEYSYLIAISTSVEPVRAQFGALQGFATNEDLNNDYISTRIPDEQPDMTDLSFVSEQSNLLLRDATNAIVRYHDATCSAGIIATGSTPSVYLDFLLYDHVTGYTTYSAKDFVQLRIKYMVPEECGDQTCTIYLNGTTALGTVTLTADGTYRTEVISISSVTSGSSATIQNLKLSFDNATEGDEIYVRGIQLLTNEDRFVNADFIPQIDMTDILTIGQDANKINNSTMEFDAEENAIKLTALNNDPWVYVNYSANNLTPDASKYNTIQFTCMIPAGQSLSYYHVDIYLKLVGVDTPISIRISSIKADGEYHTVVVPIPSGITGTIEYVRLDYLDSSAANDVMYLHSLIISADTIEQELSSVAFTDRGSPALYYAAGNNYDIWQGIFNYAYQLYEFIPIASSSQSGVTFDKSEGSLKLSADELPSDKNAQDFDPFISFRFDGLSVSTQKYSGIRIKYKVPEGSSTNQKVQFFIDTTGMDSIGLVGYQGVASTLNNIEVSGEYNYLEVDFSSLAYNGSNLWTGNIEGIRLDYFFTYYAGEPNTMYITQIELIPVN